MNRDRTPPNGHALLPCILDAAGGSCPDTEALAAFLEGRADPREARGIAAHIRICPGCAALERDVGRLPRALPAPPVRRPRRGGTLAALSGAAALFLVAALLRALAPTPERSVVLAAVGPVRLADGSRPVRGAAIAAGARLQVDPGGGLILAMTGGRIEVRSGDGSEVVTLHRVPGGPRRASARGPLRSTPPDPVLLSPRGRTPDGRPSFRWLLSGNEAGNATGEARVAVYHGDRLVWERDARGGALDYPREQPGLPAGEEFVWRLAARGGGGEASEVFRPLASGERRWLDDDRAALRLLSPGPLERHLEALVLEAYGCRGEAALLWTDLRSDPLLGAEASGGLARLLGTRP